MRVLLTGATGFIGSHLLERLLAMKFPVAILIRNSSDTWRINEFMDRAVVIRGDLSDAQAVQKPVSDFAPNILVHSAWYGVENRFRNEYEQLLLNLSYTTDLLKIIENTNIKKIIGFGSQGEYGPQSEPIDEHIKPCPTTFYGTAKLCVFNILDMFCRNKNIDFSWMRLFSIYGPKDNDSWLIPMVINKILSSEEPALTEGRQLWDFLFVDDAVDAIIGMIMSDNCQGIFNLGSGSAITIRQVVEKIRDIINPSVSLGFGRIPYRPDQVMFLQAKTDKLRAAVSWNPRISIDTGIQQTISWYQTL